MYFIKSLDPDLQCFEPFFGITIIATQQASDSSPEPK